MAKKKKTKAAAPRPKAKKKPASSAAKSRRAAKRTAKKAAFGRSASKTVPKRAVKKKVAATKKAAKSAVKKSKAAAKSRPSVREAAPATSKRAAAKSPKSAAKRTGKSAPAKKPATRTKRKATKSAADTAAAAAGSTPVEKLAGVSDEAVRKATGKPWTDWIAILDAAGAVTKAHRDIAEWLSEKFPEVGDWWSQMLTVGYEQFHGLREVNEKADGFAANISRTLTAPLAKLYAAWSSATRRIAWIPEPLSQRTANENKSMRFDWGDGTSRVLVNFYAKGNEKSQVTIQHERLPDADSVERFRELWQKRLDALMGFLSDEDV